MILLLGLWQEFFPRAANQVHNTTNSKLDRHSQLQWSCYGVALPLPLSPPGLLSRESFNISPNPPLPPRGPEAIAIPV
jgi:hypothetical protein